MASKKFILLYQKKFITMFVISFNLSQSFNYMPTNQIRDQLFLYTVPVLFFRFTFFASHQLSYFRFVAQRREKPFFSLQKKQFFYTDTQIQAGTYRTHYTHRYASTSIYLIIYMLIQSFIDTYIQLSRFILFLHSLPIRIGLVH